MTTLHTAKPTRTALVLVVACTAAVVGLAAGRAPAPALAGSLAVVAVAVAASSLTAAVAAYVAMSVTFLGARPQLMLVAGLGLGVAWLAHAAVTRQVGPRALTTTHPGLIVAFAAFLGWVALTQLWAPDVAAVNATVERYAILFVVFGATFAAGQSRRGVIVIAAAFVIGTAASAVGAALGLDVFRDSDPSGANPYGARFVGGPSADPNIFATLLLAGSVLAAALSSRRAGLNAGTRWAFAAIAVALLVSVGATGSRGAFVTLIAMILVLPIVAHRRRLAAVALVAALMGLAAMLATSSWSPMADRFQEVGFDSSGRIELWDVGWAMANDRPLTGVGAGNFRQTSSQYLLGVGLLREDDYIVDRPLVVHNSYLQLLAETGIPGLVLFAFIVVYCAACAARATREFAARGDPGMELIAGAVLISLIGFAVAMIFLSYLDYARPFAVLLALGPALAAMARRRTHALAPSGESGLHMALTSVRRP